MTASVLTVSIPEETENRHGHLSSSSSNTCATSIQRTSTQQFNIGHPQSHTLSILVYYCCFIM